MNCPSPALSRRGPPLPLPPPSWSPAPDRAPAPINQWHMDMEFMALLKACRVGRGLARIDELVRRMAGAVEEPRAFIEAALANRALCSLRWRGQTWLPLCQFAPGSWRPKAAVAQVIAELSPALTPAALCLWFCEPHPALEGRAPWQLLESEPHAVHAAALSTFLALSTLAARNAPPR